MGLGFVLQGEHRGSEAPPRGSYEMAAGEQGTQEKVGVGGQEAERGCGI